MLNGKIVAVVVPSYNEESQIGMVLETMPDFVDRIVVVNDCSTDGTAKVVEEYIAGDHAATIKLEPEPPLEATLYNEAERVVQELNQQEDRLYYPCEIPNQTPESDRVILINLTKNGGVGAAIARGYKWTRDHLVDCTAVMAGDGQMDPAELESICLPVIDEGVDYVKGNRLLHRSAFLVVPKIRYLGNSVLSLLTKIASGYWRISDTQSGYTAISLKALNAVRLHKIYRSYGMPNDLLVKLNIAYCSLREVEIKPIYRVGEKSKMKIGLVIPRVSLLLAKSFIARLWKKYFFRDFHPLFLLYNLAFVLGAADIPIVARIVRDLIEGKSITYQILLLFLFTTISGFQSLFFAMWMDIQDNERLYS